MPPSHIVLQQMNESILKIFSLNSFSPW